MGWDEAQGTLPCEYWRWDRLIRRCEVQAMEATVRGELARFDAEKIHGQAAALLLKPMSDRHRRAMADYFTSLDWQRFSQLAQDIEYQYPEVPQRLGLQPLDNWRDWLPATHYSGVYLFLWLALSALLVVSLLSGSSKKYRVGHHGPYADLHDGGDVGRPEGLPGVGHGGRGGWGSWMCCSVDGYSRGVGIGKAPGSWCCATSSPVQYRQSWRTPGPVMCCGCSGSAPWWCSWARFISPTLR